MRRSSPKVSRKSCRQEVQIMQSQNSKEETKRSASLLHFVKSHNDATPHGYNTYATVATRAT